MIVGMTPHKWNIQKGLGITLSWCIYLFSGDFLFCTAFTDHRVLGTNLIMCLRQKKIHLQSPKMSSVGRLHKSCLLNKTQRATFSTLMFLKWNGSLQYLQLSVLSGHSRSLWRSCSLKRMCSLQEGHEMIMNSHFPSWLSWKEQTVSWAAASARAMGVKGADLVLLNGSFPGAVFVDTHGRKVFDFPSNSVVRKSLKPPENKKSIHAFVHHMCIGIMQGCHWIGVTLIMLITLSNILTHPCFKIDVGSSKISSLMQAPHFWGPLLKQQHKECTNFNLKYLLFRFIPSLETQLIWKNISKGKIIKLAFRCDF